MGQAQYWDVTNTNTMDGGMVHPFHVHGTQFLIISRNGKAPYPNEHGYKDTVGVNPGETVRLLVRFDLPGVYMYHCHIIEHEDGGMMAQIESYDPSLPRPTYKLMDMDTLAKPLRLNAGFPYQNCGWLAWILTKNGHEDVTLIDGQTYLGLSSPQPDGSGEHNVRSYHVVIYRNHPDFRFDYQPHTQ